MGGWVRRGGRRHIFLKPSNACNAWPPHAYCWGAVRSWRSRNLSTFPRQVPHHDF